MCANGRELGQLLLRLGKNCGVCDEWGFDGYRHIEGRSGVYADFNSLPLKLAEVESADCRKELSPNAAVESTDASLSRAQPPPTTADDLSSIDARFYAIAGL